MPLSKEEQEQLEALQRKADEPDPPAGGGSTRNLNITIDLGDPDQVKRGLKLGLLERGDLDEFDDPDPDGDDPPADDEPRRRQRYE